MVLFNMVRCKNCDKIIRNRNSKKYCSRQCQMKAWYLRNKVHRKNYRRDWYLKNKERVIELEKNNGAIRRKTLRNKNKLFLRYLKNKGINCDLSFNEFRLVKTRDKICVYCNTKEATDIDHITSVKNKGQAQFINFVGACKSCNCSKESEWLFNWLDSRYCQENNISMNTISPIVLTLLNRRKNE